MSLEDYIRFHLAKNEQMADFTIATETVRALIDVYNSCHYKEMLSGSEERCKKLLESYISDGKKICNCIDTTISEYIIKNEKSPAFILISENDFKKMKIYTSEVLSMDYNKNGKFYYKSIPLVRTKDIAERTVFAVR